MQRIKPADVEWMESGFVREVEKDQDIGSREGDWSPASFSSPKERASWTRHGCIKVMSYGDLRLRTRIGTSSCQGFSEKYASAGDLAGMGMRMLMELEVPEKKGQHVVQHWCEYAQ